MKKLATLFLFAVLILLPATLVAESSGMVGLEVTANSHTPEVTQPGESSLYTAFVHQDSCLPPTTADAGPDQSVCVTTTTLDGNTPSSGTGTGSVTTATPTVPTPGLPLPGVTAF